MKSRAPSKPFAATSPGYTVRRPIIDGWNRQRACNEIGIKPEYVTFAGTDGEAIAFVMRTNKRRNLNSGQWACIAAEADDLLAVIREKAEDERKAKISAARTDETTQKNCAISKRRCVRRK